MNITKTKIKALNDALRLGNGKTELFKRLMKKNVEVSPSYIALLINAKGRVPNGITPKIRAVYEEAELFVKELKEANK